MPRHLWIEYIFNDIQFWRCNKLFIILWTEGEIQGTVHRRLLEDRVDELKVGAVLLLKQVRLTAIVSYSFFFFCQVFQLKLNVQRIQRQLLCSLCGQVGVFSPSHRNHYLNVTPNNLLRIYAPDGVSLTSTRLPPLILVSSTTVS